MLWGSNARETHPIMFQHMLKGQRNGAHLVVVDPRRTASARWAQEHAALRRGIGHRARQRHGARRDRRGPSARLVHRQQHPRLRGVPGVGGRIHPRVGGARDRRPRRADPADRAALRDGRPRHHLLDPRDHRAPQRRRQRPRAHQPGAPHRPRRPSGLRLESPARARTTSRAAATWARCRSACPASRTSSIPARRRPFEERWGVRLSSTRGLNVTEMLEAAGEGTLHALYVIGENPAVSDADTHHVEKALGRLDLLVVEDLFLTRTAQLAHVVLPAAAGWCETEGTVTASDRRVQRDPEGARSAAGGPRRPRGRPGRRAPARRRLVAAPDGPGDLGRAPRRCPRSTAG